MDIHGQWSSEDLGWGVWVGTGRRAVKEGKVGDICNTNNNKDIFKK